MAYCEFARGHELLLHKPVKLYSFRQNFWVFVWNLYWQKSLLIIDHTISSLCGILKLNFFVLIFSIINKQMSKLVMSRDQNLHESRVNSVNDDFFWVKNLQIFVWLTLEWDIISSWLSHSRLPQIMFDFSRLQKINIFDHFSANYA